MRAIAPGLHFVATPIGAARDITLRALDILAGAEILAAEDTRTLRHLMEIHGIALGDRPLLSYHDHNGTAVRPRLLAALAEGRAVAYASEAGTPLVADPGFQLARAAIAGGYAVLAAPGPSAVLAALTVSGLPTDRFLFAGFPPAGAGDRAPCRRQRADHRPAGWRHPAARECAGRAARPGRVRSHGVSAHPARHLVQALGQHDDEPGLGADR